MQFDIVLFGATSFVGKILTHHFVSLQPNHPELNWAIAGRSKSKLEELRSSLPSEFSALPIVVVDAHDEAKIKELCESAKTIVSTVGPYALYGETLLKTCCETGTHYCDLTGEPQWVYKMIQKYENLAKQSGARIVPCSGFDSIPSDLGVYFTQKEAFAEHGKYCPVVKMGVKALGGGMSGGTVASIFNVSEEIKKDPSLRKILGNPYSLCPKDGPKKIRQKDINTAQFDQDFDAWTAPFIMAGINTRVVHRSHQLSQMMYGDEFTYTEAMMMGKKTKGWIKAQTFTLGLAGFMIGSYFSLSKKLLEKVLPKPGEGPSPEQQEKGFFDLRFLGKLTVDGEGKEVRVKVTGDRDPGYGSTAKMLAQTALCLSLDLADDDEKGGGFWTPASLMGDILLARLEAYAGINFELLD